MTAQTTTKSSGLGFLFLEGLAPFFVDLKFRAVDFMRSTPIYDWVLSDKQPQKFIVELGDVWPGDSGRGRWLCNEVLDCKGSLLKAENGFWDQKIDYKAQYNHLHGFGWLRDLKALGGDVARGQARKQIDRWIHKYYRWNAIAWHKNVLGVRLSNWIKLYSFFGASADDHFQSLFFQSVSKQYKHLCNILPETYESVADLQLICALIYGGLSMKGQETKLEKGLELLDKALAVLVLEDGGFVTRSPADLVEAVQCILDLKTALKEAGYPVTPVIEQTLDRAIPALRFFRYEDRKLCVFNNAQEGEEDILALIFKRAGVRGKTWKSLPFSGYERIEHGKTLLMMDTGLPSRSAETLPLHAGPLAFELCYGKDRVLTNCGTHPVHPDWIYALRSTPAHNTLTVDHRNAYEIKDNGHIGRANTISQSERKDLDGASLITASHDGYFTVNGLVHQRRIYVSPDGHDIRGEDTLERRVFSGRPHHYAIRFHLHPTVKVSMVSGGSEALLKTKSGTGWRFFASGSYNVRLEDSIYLGKGAEPRKTKQIVLEGETTAPMTTVKWAIQREGV